MVEKIRTLARLHRDKIILSCGLLITVAISLWLLKPTELSIPQKEEGEIGLLVPVDSVVMPLELINAASLDQLVEEKAVVNLYREGQAKPLIENLKIFKLRAGEGPLFGALVPKGWAGQLTFYFSKPKLSGALVRNGREPVTLHLPSAPLARPLLSEVPVTEVEL